MFRSRAPFPHSMEKLVFQTFSDEESCCSWFFMQTSPYWRERQVAAAAWVDARNWIRDQRSWKHQCLEAVLIVFSCLVPYGTDVTRHTQPNPSAVLVLLATHPHHRTSVTARTLCARGLLCVPVQPPVAMSPGLKVTLTLPALPMGCCGFFLLLWFFFFFSFNVIVFPYNTFAISNLSAIQTMDPRSPKGQGSRAVVQTQCQSLSHPRTGHPGVWATVWDWWHASSWECGICVLS